MPDAKRPGRVFFHNPVATALVGVGDFSCSASAINSASKEMVIAAAHCVNGGPGRTWYHNWYFAPSYADGVESYGRYYAKSFRTFNSWINNTDFRREVGLVTTWLGTASDGKLISQVGG